MKLSQPIASNRSLLTFFLLASLSAALLLPFDTGQSEIEKVLTDASHAPLFAAVSIAVLKIMQSPGMSTNAHRGLYIKAFFISLTLGVFGEIAQLLFTSNRHAQVKDVIVDGCGAMAGLCLLARHDKQLQLNARYRRALMPLVLSASLIVVAPIAWSGAFYAKRRLQAPELATFESRLGYHFLSAGNAEAIRAMVPPQFTTRTGELALYIVPKLDSRWAGITLEELLPDWNAYDRLEIEIVNPNDAALEIFLRIDDRSHNQEFTDRFNRSLTVAPKQRSILTVMMSDIRSAPATRLMETAEMSRLVLFQDTQRNALAFYLCSLRLSK